MLNESGRMGTLNAYRMKRWRFVRVVNDSKDGRASVEKGREGGAGSAYVLIVCVYEDRRQRMPAILYFSIVINNKGLFVLFLLENYKKYNIKIWNGGTCNAPDKR